MNKTQTSYRFVYGKTTTTWASKYIELHVSITR